MSAKSDAAAPGAAIPDVGDPAKARFVFKNKKLILVGGVAVVVLVLIGAGGWLYFGNKPAGEGDSATEVAAEAEAAVEAEVAVEVEAEDTGPRHPPTFLPLDNMVVNLADPGGEKIAQIGITLEIADAKALEKVRLYLPTIRSAILLLVSQRTAEELLRREGKEKLAADILREASRPFNGGQAGHMPEKGKKKSADEKGFEDGPVRGVLFSSLIVQ